MVLHKLIVLPNRFKVKDRALIIKPAQKTITNVISGLVLYMRVKPCEYIIFHIVHSVYNLMDLEPYTGNISFFVLYTLWSIIIFESVYIYL